MRASVGDRIVVASTIVDQPPRDGRVVEVRHPDGSPPYVVEWSDTGEQTLLFPGPDTRVDTGEPAPEAAGSAASAVEKTWTVHVRISEHGDDTAAVAVLGVDGPTRLDAEGRSHRNPDDPRSPVIGDEVAVARALRLLADRLLETAESDISISTGVPAELRN